ncbi:MAG TPA: XRE family transcriptional regulator [Acetobacteraceae bacterium]|jgi:Zn-dependent peptidase ImmA (M78 family)/transcriptional regulator with XRE-family HTH domain|nr:XRE family transcriptional regulator [Acetobacteraceae bacterium]
MDIGTSERINPDILKWARETAGLSLAEAAEKLGLKDTAKATAAEKLHKLEAGGGDPGQTFLRKAVAAYRRPLITFYLPAPPKRGERGEDFRSQTGAVSARDNATLDALVRDVRARQQILREALEDSDDGTESLPFVGSAYVADGPRSVVAAMRTTLGITEHQQRLCKGATQLFALLRSAAERAGIYVLLLGDVGSYHSDIGENVFRGFSLVDELAPFVVINDNDAEVARPFTLIHELAHIWIGASGVSGPLRGVPENIIERSCNDIASEFLLPPDAIPDFSNLQTADFDGVYAAVGRLADLWNVSEPAVAYRFAQNGWISGAVASSLFVMFAERWRREKEREKQNKKPEDTGLSFYTVRRHRLGAGLLAVVRRALQEETLTYTRAAKILGVGPASVPPLLREERFSPR